MEVEIGHEYHDGSFQLRIFQGSPILPSGYEGFCLTLLRCDATQPLEKRSATQPRANQEHKNLQVETLPSLSSLLAAVLPHPNTTSKEGIQKS